MHATKLKTWAGTILALGLLWLSATINDGGILKSGFFDTANTPAVRGNRAYVSTQFEESATHTTLPYGRESAAALRSNAM